MIEMKQMRQGFVMIKLTPVGAAKTVLPDFISEQFVTSLGSFLNRHKIWLIDIFF